MRFIRTRVFAIAVAVALLAGCGMSADTKTAELAVTQFHQMLDAGQIDAIYAASSDDLKKITTHAQFVTFLDSVRAKAGATKSTSEKSWHLDFKTTGNIVTLGYATVFATAHAKETFVFRVQDSKALLVGYHIE